MWRCCRGISGIDKLPGWLCRKYDLADWWNGHCLSWTTDNTSLRQTFHHVRHEAATVPIPKGPGQDSASISRRFAHHTLKLLSYISTFQLSCLQKRPSLVDQALWITTTDLLVNLEVLAFAPDVFLGGWINRHPINPEWRWSTMVVDSPHGLPALGSLSFHPEGTSTSSLDVPTTSPSLIAKTPPAHHRSHTLRARPSNPFLPTSSSSKPSSPVTTYRKPSQKELDNIQRRLGPEALVSHREELIKEKEGELKRVVDGHDDDVREKFHLDRYISLLEGWDPAVSSSSEPTLVNAGQFNRQTDPNAGGEEG